MASNILLIQAHPDDHPHFNHALLRAYEQGALQARHAVKIIQVPKLKFTLLVSQQQWQDEPVEADILAAQQAIEWADHIVIFFPLWMGTMPAILKAFLEQTLRPSFVNNRAGGLHGVRVRVVVTMAMPALVYRWFFRAHGLKNLQRNILRFCGAKPVRATLIGQVHGLSEAKAQRWLQKVQQLGQKAI